MATNTKNKRIKLSSKNMETENNSLINWSNASLSSAIQNLRMNTDLADFTVTCGDKEWKVHSVILCARSPFFNAAITTNMAEKLEMKIHIKEFDPEAMDGVLNFMYGVPKEKVPIKFLFEAAERFQMDDLKEYAVKLARKEMTKTNVMELAHLAETYGIEEFHGECAKFMVKNNVPFKEEDMSSKLAMMVVNILKGANQKLKEKLTNEKLEKNAFKRSYNNTGEFEWGRVHNINLNGEILEYDGSDCDSGFAQAKKPLSTSNYYFEIEILEPGVINYIAIGLTRKNSPSTGLPGYNKGSIAYHADDGKVFMGRTTGDAFGPICNEGDIMGCGVLFKDNKSDSEEKVEESGSEEEGDEYDTDSEEDEDQKENTHHGDNPHVYFTRNGKVIGMRQVALPKNGFFPSVGMSSPQEKIRVNLNPNFNPVSME